MRCVMLAVLLAAGTANAQAPGETAPVDHAPTTSAAPGAREDVPARCRQLAQLAAVPQPEIALSSKVSLASCEAEERMRPLQLIDSELSAHQLEEAIAPSLQLLDEVIASGGPRWQIAAFHAEGALRQGMAVRLLATLPVLPENPSPERVRMHDLRAQMLRARVQPWLDRAQQDFAEVGRIAKQHAELANDAVVAAAVQDSERTRTPVATR